jgi:uncharacterized protein (DUF849 family)
MDSLKQQTKHKIVLAVGPNGSRRGKSDHSALPITKAEIVREAASWRDAGASMVHLHIRDADGRHSLDPDIYKDVLSAVREVVGQDMVLQMTTEAGGIFDRETQMAAARAVRPEAISLALREIAPDQRHDGELAEFLGWMRKEGIAPQVILYDRGDLIRLLDLARLGTIDGAATSVLYVLGRYSQDQTSKPVELLSFLGVRGLPFRDWMVCAFGREESRCAALAALLGGHVRVGFENNLWLPDGQLAPDNAALVEAVVDSLGRLGLSPAGADDARS